MALFELVKRAEGAEGEGNSLIDFGKGKGAALGEHTEHSGCRDGFTQLGRSLKRLNMKGRTGARKNKTKEGSEQIDLALRYMGAIT